MTHHVEVAELGTWLAQRIGFDPRAGISTRHWLCAPQQRLLEVTSGAVFHDDDGELAAVRAALAWYPDDVWLWLLACQWRRLDQEEPFVGRAAEVGDELGSRVVAARLVRDVDAPRVSARASLRAVQQVARLRVRAARRGGDASAGVARRSRGSRLRARARQRSSRQSKSSRADTTPWESRRPSTRRCASSTRVRSASSARLASSTRVSTACAIRGSLAAADRRRRPDQRLDGRARGRGRLRRGRPALRLKDEPGRREARLGRRASGSPRDRRRLGSSGAARRRRRRGGRGRRRRPRRGRRGHGRRVVGAVAARTRPMGAATARERKMPVAAAILLSFMGTSCGWGEAVRTGSRRSVPAAMGRWSYDSAVTTRVMPWSRAQSAAWTRSVTPICR